MILGLEGRQVAERVPGGVREQGTTGPGVPSGPGEGEPGQGRTTARLPGRRLPWRVVAALAGAAVVLAVVAGFWLGSRRLAPGGQALSTAGWLTRGEAALKSGNFDAAMAAFEQALRGREQPLSNEQRALIRANIGLAAFYKAEQVRRAGGARAARRLYRRAAEEFKAFIKEAHLPGLKLVGEYYLMGALGYAGAYDELVAVGEHFLSSRPEQLVKQGLLPASAPGSALELMAVAHMELSRRRPGQAEEHRAKSLAYAAAAVASYPDVAVHSYLLTGLEAARRGERELARQRLTRYLSHMRRLPQTQLDELDRRDIARAEEALQSLGP